jgi:hypothetical protein
MSREQNQQEFPSKSKGLAGNLKSLATVSQSLEEKIFCPQRLRMEGLLT